MLPNDEFLSGVEAPCEFFLLLFPKLKSPRGDLLLPEDFLAGVVVTLRSSLLRCVPCDSGAFADGEAIALSAFTARMSLEEALVSAGGTPPLEGMLAGNLLSESFALSSPPSPANGRLSRLDISSPRLLGLPKLNNWQGGAERCSKHSV